MAPYPTALLEGDMVSRQPTEKEQHSARSGRPVPEGALGGPEPKTVQRILLAWGGRGRDPVQLAACIAVEKTAPPHGEKSWNCPKARQAGGRNGCVSAPGVRAVLTLRSVCGRWGVSRLRGCGEVR